VSALRRLMAVGMPVAGMINAMAEMREGGVAPELAHDPERDRAIVAMLPLVPEMGWSVRALREAAGPDADLMFPGGPAEMAEAHSDLGDRRMRDGLVDSLETRQSRRVRALVLLRLEQSADEREAIRRGLSLLSLPANQVAGARALARTADTIWNTAGDTATGFSRHSKRAILAAVYSATLLFWLRDGDMLATEAFLDRRLAGVARMGKLTRR
jgi:ubiquinone biosynthesis protein COQ9